MSSQAKAPSADARRMTAAEYQELSRLQRAWAAHTATRRQILRCQELESMDRAWVLYREAHK
jgi:hypothetical protein